MASIHYPEEPIPQPPRLRPTWTTWMWLAFLIAVIVFTFIGLWSPAR